MNFYKFGISELKNRGMFPTQAVAIMQKEVEENKEMTERWGEDTSYYPPMMKNILWMGIEQKALEYIKENCPEAWFRPVFDPEHPLRKQFEESQAVTTK